jgi:trk system potassium uptake protein TrkA
MRQQALVIGLGQFGMAVARSLVKRGLEVLAVDRREELIEVASGFATEVLALDVTDEATLAQTRPGERDLAVCAIGEDAKEASIICTALLRQQGAPRVIARAGDPVHARILHLVGAHVVVNPEYEMGERLANRLVYESIVSDMPLGDGLWVTEFTVPDGFAGRSLKDLALPSEHGVMVIAIRRAEGRVLLPKADLVLEKGESLVVVSTEADLQSLLEDVRS